MTRHLAGALGVLALVGSTAACGGGSDVSSGDHTLEFTITDAGCNPATATATPGQTKFHVRNTGANSITEFEVLDSAHTIVGERENLTPGLEGSFTIDLRAGTYILACPGGTENPTGTLTVAAAGAGASSAAHGDEHDMAADCVPTASAGPNATKVDATLSDFKIDLGSTSVKAGAVEIEGTNKGVHPHEIVVVKGVASNALPTDANGAVDEDKLPPGALVGEVEAFGPGRTCSGGFDLPAGSYTLFCNVQGAEEGAHFRNGMVTSLVVS